MEYTSRNPHYRQTLIEKIDLNFFMQHLGVVVNSISPGSMEIELDVKKEHTQQNGFVHGGIISTMGDIAMGFAAYSLVGEGEGTVTSDLKVAYLRPGTGNKIIARGTVIKPGKHLFYCECDILSISSTGEKILIARAYSTMAAVKH